MIFAHPHTLSRAKWLPDFSVFLLSVCTSMNSSPTLACGGGGGWPQKSNDSTESQVRYTLFTHDKLNIGCSTMDFSIKFTVEVS